MSYVPYQIDYKVSGAGKTLGVTKKKVLWKFGFANPEALREGLSGSQCRGSEHEVLFTWSLASGKRQISCDGKECHYSESGMNGWTADRTFDHHFNLFSPNYGNIRCHLITLTPDANAPGGNRPFILKVNGVNFFDFNSLFQLGTPAMIVRPAPNGGSGRPGSESDPNISQEERQAIARAKIESLRDIRKTSSRDSTEQQLAAPISDNQSLISFDDPPPLQGMYAGGNRTMSSMTLDFRSGSIDSGFNPTTPTANAYSNYALPPATSPQFAQKPAPAQFEYGQQAGAAQYGQQPAAPQYGQQPATPQYAHQPAAPQYGQQPGAPQYGQQPAAPQYGHQPGVPQYSQQPVAPQYGQQPGAPQYGQQPAAPPYGQQAGVPQYGQQGSVSQFSQPSAAPQYSQPPADVQYSQSGAMTPYGQAPAAAAPTTYSSFDFSQPPAPPPATQQPDMSGYTAAAAPGAAPAWGAHSSYYTEQAPPMVNTAAVPSTPGGYGTAATPQSHMSYGSAPSFAQPPRHQQPGQYGGY